MSKRVFVLIAAVSEYHGKGMPKLPGVRRDAERLRATLAKCPEGDVHRVFWLPDGKAGKQDLLDALAEIASQAGATDQVVVYFGGHGWRQRDADGKHWKYYLIPYDATFTTAATRGLATEELGTALGTLHAQELVLILDSCHSGGVPDFRWMSELQDELLEGWRSYFVMAAARGREEAGEQDWGGFFMQALCDALEGHGVVPDKLGHLRAEGLLHAAEAANVEAAKNDHRQTAVSVGMGSPIYLTRPQRSPLAAPSSFFIAAYPRSQDPRFFEEVRKLIPRLCIILIGTGLNLLWEQHILDLLIQRATAGDGKIDICLGNPFSPHVQSRLVEEQMRWRTPPMGKQGIERNVTALVERLRTAPGMNVTLFEHNPTFATLIFDRDIFVYSYGYHELGNTSPLFHFQDDGSEEARFFLENAQHTLQDAVPAAAVVHARRDPKYFSNQWTAAAVYIVPEAGDPLYKFGSAILGYDLHQQRAPRPEDCPLPGFRQYVGEAAEYGFHATLADALYFATEAEIERVKAELRFLADEFSPFELAGFKVATPFHDDPAILALRCDDRSGKVEALHHELVARIYRLAISSTYRAGTTRKRATSRKSARADFMVQRYGAPYILQEFELHFTLCSKWSSEPKERARLVEGIADVFTASVGNPTVPVHDIYLVTRRAGASHWTIEAKFHLGGQANSAR